LVWSTFQRPYGEVGEKTVPDAVTGQTVVTNLRLPGQYDERLLASVGLQGPYYNWNRWYLPSVGRYLELDPIALAGGFNGFYGPNWYGYAEGNPLRYSDPWGLEVYMCCRELDVNWGADFLADLFGFKHCFLMTNGAECGMGPANDGPLPAWPLGIPTKIVPHYGQGVPWSPMCKLIPDVNERCVTNVCQKGGSTGNWGPTNNCNTWAKKTLDSCRAK
jgi:RHS repeat-associated protein